MRIVFDTNILILSFLGNPATAILQAALTSESLAFFYSRAMLDEYHEALEQAARERPMPFHPERVAALLAEVEAHGHLIRPTVTLTTEDENACTHEPDNRFLECAITAEADYIITVNSEHFPKAYQRIEVIGPTQLSQIIFSV